MLLTRRVVPPRDFGRPALAQAKRRALGLAATLIFTVTVCPDPLLQAISETHTGPAVMVFDVHRLGKIESGTHSAGRTRTPANPPFRAFDTCHMRGFQPYTQVQRFLLRSPSSGGRLVSSSSRSRRCAAARLPIAALSLRALLVTLEYSTLFDLERLQDETASLLRRLSFLPSAMAADSSS